VALSEKERAVAFLVLGRRLVLRPEGGRSRQLYLETEAREPGHSGSTLQEAEFEPGKPRHLRLTRRGDSWRMEDSADGEKWSLVSSRTMGMPRKLQVGVVAVSTAEGTFQPVFDQFKLTLLR
jgi:hypothetical protein